MFKPADVVSNDRPLLRIVATWPGRGPTQLAFEARGFALHRAWQDRVIEFCGQEQSCLLNRYWDEVAQETVLCLGRGVPDTRVFVIQPSHRSKFLDELFTARDFLEPEYPSPPLIKCLFEYEKRILRDAEFRESERAVFVDLQKAESERLGIPATEWSGKKRDVIPFVDQFCGALGFERHGKRWRKKSDRGLIFEVAVDLGGQPYCLTVPLKYQIYHSDDRKLVFDITGDAVLQHMIPGSFLYRHGRSADEWVLGIKAYIELFDVIACSL